MPKYLPTSFTLLLVITLLGCHFSKTPSSVKEFEGVITYKAYYTDPNDTTSFNDTIKCFYSHGNILRLHLGPNPGKIKKDIFIAEENKRYGTFGTSDSIYCFDAGEKKDADQNFKISPSADTILSHNCEKFTATATHVRHNIPYHTITEYTFSKHYLPIDKEHFTDCNYDAFNEYTSRCGSFYLAYSFTSLAPDGKVAMGMFYQAISVEEKKLDPAIFEIDKTKLIDIRQP